MIPGGGNRVCSSNGSKMKPKSKSRESNTYSPNRMHCKVKKEKGRHNYYPHSPPSPVPNNQQPTGSNFFPFLSFSTTEERDQKNVLQSLKLRVNPKLWMRFTMRNGLLSKNSGRNF